VSEFYDKYCEEKVEVPEHFAKFLEEYRALCKKYSVTIISPGEEVIIADNLYEDLWGLEAHTACDIRYQKLRDQGINPYTFGNGEEQRDETH